MRYAPPIALFLALVATSATAQQRERTWTAIVDTVGSVPRVTSPGYTRWRDSTLGWRLVLERTFELRDADSNSWNLRYRPLLLRDGRVVVARPTPPRIELYDVEGRFVRMIGREGLGPEEFRSVSSLADLGDTIAVYDGRAGSVLLYTLDGRYVRRFPVDIYTDADVMSVDPRGHLRIRQEYGGSERIRTQWVHFTSRGVRIDSIQRIPLEPPPRWETVDGTRHMLFQIPYAPLVRDDFLADGSLLYGRGDAWRFVVSRTGRDTALVFARTNVEPVPISTGHADSTFASATAQNAALQSVARRADMPETYPLWVDLRVDGRGFIWVSTGYWFRRDHHWAVFAPTGHYLGPVRSWFERFEPTSWAGDHIAYVGFLPGRRPAMRIYRIDRRED